MTGAAAWFKVLAERAAAGPDDLALVVEGGDDLTFGRWEGRSTAVARGLVSRGVGIDERVALRFDARQWADFAITYLGVLKAGAVAVLVPSGLADPDAARIVRHSGASVVLGPPPLTQLPAATWTAEPPEIERSASDPVAATTRTVRRLAATAELVYPRAPMARPRPLVRTHADLGVQPGPNRPGWLVHTWAPGSLAGQLALAQVLSGAGTTLATLARFSPDAFCALVARLGASTCGLTPGLAAALAASPAATTSDLRSVTMVVRSPKAHGHVSLSAAFPEAIVLDHFEEAIPASRDEAVPAPAGASQLGMLWHEQLAPGSFNLPCLVRRYQGRLDVAAMARALAELVRRHEPLRTTFELVGSAPRQIVRPSSVGLPVIDLSGLDPAARSAEAAALIAEATNRPFDLVDDPLFAPRLVRVDDDDHVLIVRLHHTAFDDWSVDVYRRELSALYTAFAAGQPSPLPRPPARFVDACRRQQLRLDGSAGDEQRTWWRAQMAGAPLATQLPLGDADQIGPDRPGAGEPLRADLPGELTVQVRRVAARLRATPFMTVLAAFEVLLARRTEQDDLVIASVVAGRDATALEPLIGCFTKKVLLRLQVGGNPTFAELVARTRATVLDAVAHQELPFEAVVQDTLGRAAAAAHGLAAPVPIVFQGETPQLARLVLRGLEVGPFEVPAAARRERHFSASEDAGPRWGDGAHLGTFLLLSVLEAEEGGLALIARGVFHRPAAQRLLEDLEALLTALVSSPGRSLSELGPAASGGPPAPDGDHLVLHGLPIRRSRLEAALSGCAGVAAVAVSIDHRGGAARLVAHVVADGHPPPTLAQLRSSLWATLPGSPWPAEIIVVEALPHHGAAPDAHPDPQPPDPLAGLLTAVWSESRGRDAAPDTSYWQDFSFLHALAEARAAGLPITNEHVTRCRTPEMLAAALATSDAVRPVR